MSQSNYKKVDKPRNNNNSDASSSSIQKNEIRITAQGRSRSYISYAVGLLDPSLLQKDEATTTTTTTESTSQQQQYDTVVLKAMGKAIQKAVTIAEVLKRRVAGLHQNTSIESQEIEDQYEPKEEGMDVVIKKRTVSSIIIKLSKKALDVNALGYQPPIPEDQVTAPQIISAKRVPGGMGGAGGADAGKRRKRRVRGGGAARGGASRASSSGGVNNQQQQPTKTTPTNNNNNNNTGNQQQSTKTSGGNQQQQQGSTVQNRGRGRGRGGGSRGGGSRGRGGRGQPRKPTGGNNNNTGAAVTTNQQ